MTRLITRRTAALALGSAALMPVFARKALAQDAPETSYILGDVELGQLDAPVTVLEYASFTCPHCAAFHEQTWPKLKAEYIDTGKVRFILREVYFDYYGLWASMVARCGGVAGYYPLVDRIMAKQQEWTRAENPTEAVKAIGRRAGISSDRMDACFSDESFPEKLVEDYHNNAFADDVKSTPTFIINGETHVGNMSFEDFSALIEAEL